MRNLRFFYSFWAILLAIFIYAFSCGVATFIENDYGVIASRAIVYDSWWFEILHIYLILALIASFIKSNAFKHKKYASLILHFSFIVIIIGAGITRYFGIEGEMDIKEGETADYYLSSDNFINIIALDSAFQRDSASIKANITPYGTLFLKPKIKKAIPIFDKPLSIESSDIIMIGDPKNPRMALNLNVTYNGETKQVQLFNKGAFMQEHMADSLFEIGGIQISLLWGSKKMPLPFGIHLIKFELETYAGSDNPSSYASEVEVMDKQGKALFPFRIFMNNVLDYQGYRFYQSKYYGIQGKMATVLSVNRDPGKIPTYIGYALLILGALLVLFDKNGRFRTLARFLHNQQITSFALALLVALSFGAPKTYANATPNPHVLESNTQDSSPESSDTESNVKSSRFVIPTEAIKTRLEFLKKNSKAFAKEFGRIQVQQEESGRIMPFDTMAMNIVHKIYKKDGFKGLDNVQVALGMMIDSQDWALMNIIATDTPKLRQILGVSKDQKYVSWFDIYNPILRESKLKNYVADIIAHIPESQRGTFEKDVLRVNNRYIIMNNAQNLFYFKAFPDSKTQRWFSAIELMILKSSGEIPEEDFDRIGKVAIEITQKLFKGIQEGIELNSWGNALNALNELKAYQQANAGENYVSQKRIDWEIWLNHHNIFKSLALPYLALGILSFVMILIFIVINKPLPKRISYALYALIALCVIVHTFGLGIRWYVAGHSPWSNAYESMLYIAWASGMAGVVFFRKYFLALCAASFLSGISLIVAHIGFMDPQIGNLVPVLKSYWLNIHVCVITASYGFLGLCFVLGAFGLVLFMLRSLKKPHIDKAILSVVSLNEMSMIIGLLMLTIGNFLGGVWANESWGRYWGWDPKETWALISIGVYAIVLHLRFLNLKNMPYMFCVASVLAFYSILMTYYGVNYYLSGLHSYASGDPLPIHWSLYALVGATFALIIGAKFKSNFREAL